MVREYSMTWIASRHRWMKMYKGKRYVISCKALGAPETKEASYQAANQWWQAKRAEIDGSNVKPQPGSSEAIAGVISEWAGKPLETELEAAAAVVGFVEHFADKPLPPGMAEQILGPDRHARNKALVAQLANAPQATTEHAITAHAEIWHQHQQALVAAGQMSADRAANNQTCLAHFLAFMPGVDVDAIDAGKLSAFYLYCVGQVAARRSDPAAGWSIAYARDVFSVAKSFIRWLWERGFIELPKNIGSRSFRFGSPAQAVRTWTVGEFQMAVKEAPGKLKLAILLMANAGMTQGDVADLLDSEVDWAQGRVIRKRSKTAAHEHVPVVNVKLWPLTFELLKKYRSGTERVLLTESGLPYVRKELKGGMLVKADGLRSHWVHVRKRLGLNRPLKQLRKLGATLLEGHPVYGRFVQHFLGQSPRTVAQRHYATPSPELFDEAVEWLGKQLGQS